MRCNALHRWRGLGRRRPVPARLSRGRFVPGATTPDKIAIARFTHGQTNCGWSTPTRRRCRLTDSPRRNKGLADWNADGTQIAFTRAPRRSGQLRHLGDRRRREQRNQAHAHPRRHRDLARLVAAAPRSRSRRTRPTTSRTSG